MAEKYDEVERSMGICSYASKCNGFAAVLKARYSDFVVHEGKHECSSDEVIK